MPCIVMDSPGNEESMEILFAIICYNYLHAGGRSISIVSLKYSVLAAFQTIICLA